MILIKYITSISVVLFFKLLLLLLLLFRQCARTSGFQFNSFSSCIPIIVSISMH